MIGPLGPDPGYDHASPPRHSASIEQLRMNFHHPRDFAPHSRGCVAWHVLVAYLLVGQGLVSRSEGDEQSGFVLAPLAGHAVRRLVVWSVSERGRGISIERFPIFGACWIKK